jgi:hypothetical protein
MYRPWKNIVCKSVGLTSRKIKSNVRYGPNVLKIVNYCERRRV